MLPDFTRLGQRAPCPAGEDQVISARGGKVLRRTSGVAGTASPHSPHNAHSPHRPKPSNGAARVPAEGSCPT
jgi:hypothetical protein